jgi:penicillin-binding protein 2
VERNRDPKVTRLLLLRLLIIALAAILIGRLWQLQMVAGEKYRLLADANRLRDVDVPAPRGVMYDRNGEILARNRPSFTVEVVPGDLPADDEGEPQGSGDAQVLDRLLAILARPVTGIPLSAGGSPTPTPSPTPRPVKGKVPPAPTPNPASVIKERDPWLMPRPEIEEKIANGRLGGAYRPITVARYINEETAFLIAEDAVNLPGVQLVLEPIRDYPSGSLTSHIVGYMGHIPESELPDYESRGYQQNDQVGLTALELAFENEMRGTPSQQTIEVDVNGRKVRTVGEPKPAVPGYNLVLSLDLALQEAATKALQEAFDKSSGFTKANQGVVIALDPRNGKILALVSLPSYDNNLFAKGITDEAYSALLKDPLLPMYNEAIAGRYPPGSTFKIIMASGGLQEGVIDPGTKLGDGWDGRNDGIIWVPNDFAPWDQSLAQPFYSWTHKYGYGHGFNNVRHALSVSDDIFFYELGGGYRDIFQGLGSKRIGQYAQAFGLGAPTGIELLGEDGGLVPTSKWKRVNYAESWLTGDTYNMSIGQGYVLATPLQMANVTAAIANRGTLYKPQLVDHLTDDKGEIVRPFEPKAIRTVPVDPKNLDVVREGMYGATNFPYGTATQVKVPGVLIAGKTGTAEFFRDWNKDGQPDRDENDNLPTHAWFTSFAPYVDPEIVVTVFIANGGEGSGVAAPVANQVLLAYFNEKNGEGQGATDPAGAGPASQGKTELPKPQEQAPRPTATPAQQPGDALQQAPGAAAATPEGATQ